MDLLAVQGTLKSLLQHRSSKASILQCSAFFIVQLSHPYMTTGETIALTRRTFVGKVMSLFLICCLGWSCGERNGNPLQYSCVENPVDRGVWWAVVHRVAQSRTQLKRLSSISSSSRLVITFLPGSKHLLHLLTSWLQLPFVAILESK